MVQDPADGSVGSREQHIGGTGPPIRHHQPLKGLKLRQQSLPEAEGLHQPTGGMGEGIGPGPLAKALGRGRVVEMHPPATGRKGQGGNTTCGTGAADEGAGGGRHEQKKPTAESLPWVKVKPWDRSAEAEQTAGEGLAAQGELGGQQGNEAKHGHAAIELLGTLMKTPAVIGAYHLHAGLGGEGVKAATIFGGNGGAADHGGGGRSHGKF